MDAVEERLAELERAQLQQGMPPQSEVAQGLLTTSEFVRELQATGAEERLVARAQLIEAIWLSASDRTPEAITLWGRLVAAHGRSGDPELRRIAAAAQQNIANGLRCSGEAAAADRAMDELIAQFGDFAAVALEAEAARHAELLGRPLDAIEAGAIAVATARILVRCAPDRVASATDAAVAELRDAAPSDMREALITQLEQLRADARDN